MDSLKIKISKGLLLIISVIIVVVVATFIICKVRNQIIINKAKTGFEIIQIAYQNSLKKEKYVWDKKTKKHLNLATNL